MASDSGYYELAVNGTGGATFSERKYIRFVEKGFTIYIQTDKAVYKPGQNGRIQHNFCAVNLHETFNFFIRSYFCTVASYSVHYVLPY